MAGSLQKDFGYDDESTGDEYEAGKTNVLNYLTNFVVNL